MAPTGPPDPKRLWFGPFELDPDTGELWRDGAPVKLQPQPARVLAHLAGLSGQLVSREQIQDEIWGDTVVDFDQGLNSAIRQIRAALGDSAETPVYLETVPRRGYRFVARVERPSPPPALAQAAPTPPAILLPRRIPGPLAFGLAGAVLAIGLLAAVSLRAPAPLPAAQRARLAVLPFENLSSDQEQEYFSDGLTEELITELSRLGPQRLGVVARTSAMRYKGTDKSIQQIAQELDVGYVLEGSVRRGEKGLRITAQLILASDQAHLWAMSYDRPFADTLELQREVAARVVHALLPEILPGHSAALARALPHDPEPAARDEVLRGRYALHKLTRESAEKALAFFRKATDIDPLYAQAWVGQSQALMSMTTKPEDAARAKQAALKAIELDPELAEAHLALANVRLYSEWDWPGARSAYERAIVLAPGLAMALHAYSNYFTTLSQHEEAIVQIERALELDPVSPGVNGDLGWTYFHARRYDVAVQKSLRSLELEPNDPWATACLLHSYLQLGRPQDAVAPAQQMIRFKGASEQEVAALARGDPAGGIRAYCEWSLEWFRKQAETGPTAHGAFVLLHARLGQAGPAMDWLEKGFQGRSGFMVYTGVDPRLDLLRSDPRFVDLLRRVGPPAEAGPRS